MEIEENRSTDGEDAYGPDVDYDRCSVLASTMATFNVIPIIWQTHQADSIPIHRCIIECRNSQTERGSIMTNTANLQVLDSDRNYFTGDSSGGPGRFIYNSANPLSLAEWQADTQTANHPQDVNSKAGAPIEFAEGPYADISTPRMDKYDEFRAGGTGSEARLADAMEDRPRHTWDPALESITMIRWLARNLKPDPTTLAELTETGFTDDADIRTVGAFEYRLSEPTNVMGTVSGHVLTLSWTSPNDWRCRRVVVRFGIASGQLTEEFDAHIDGEAAGSVNIDIGDLDPSDYVFLRVWFSDGWSESSATSELQVER